MQMERSKSLACTRPIPVGIQWADSTKSLMLSLIWLTDLNLISSRLKGIRSGLWQIANVWVSWEASFATGSTKRVIFITLSRRNLRALLAKLDGFPKDSKKTVYKDMDDGQVLVVTAEEDDIHYRLHTPGTMHPETEVRITERIE